MRVGLLGLGDGGRCNLKGLVAARADIVAVCDRDEAVLQAAMPDVGSATRFCTTLPEFLRHDIELVVVATPDDRHLAPTRAALEADKRVFVEKPAATTRSDLKKLKGLVEKYPRRILFSEKYSFAHPVQAALSHRARLGQFLCGTTLYTMGQCDRIMGGGKWRTECAYNPCAGGLSHNFMTALLLVGSPIVRVRATGRVLTYHEHLDHFRGYDTMEGTLEFAGGQRLTWLVCLAAQGTDSPFEHRTVAHVFQFEHGSLAYGPTPQSDQLIVEGEHVVFPAEPGADGWTDYNYALYANMHRDVLASVATGRPALHDISQGINVAYACCLAFESAKRDGRWIKVPG